MDVLEKNEATISPKKTSAPHNTKGPSYYSKEWRNMHHRPGYKAYDQVQLSNSLSSKRFRLIRLD